MEKKRPHEPRFNVTEEKDGEHSKTIRIEPGVSDLGNETVVCDSCSRDFTDSDEQGGFLFQSKAIGPCCQRKTILNIIEYGEQQYVRGSCPTGTSFADWVREVVRA